MLFLRVGAEQYVVVVQEEDVIYRSGVGDEQHYVDLFPETIAINFRLNTDNVRLALKRNRNINSDVHVYTDDVNGMISRWNPPSNDVSIVSSTVTSMAVEVPELVQSLLRIVVTRRRFGARTCT